MKECAACEGDKLVRCAWCRGLGSRHPETPGSLTCHACGGSGHVKCETCHGTGEVEDDNEPLSIA